MTAVIAVDPGAPAADAMARAAEVLRRGGLVAFPTETVYGLGAHALDRAAVTRIFDAKGRPATDPLIVHVSSLADVAPLVSVVPATLPQLAERFWPGPLTVVLPRSAIVPDQVTAGLTTVAVRVPAHPIARALLAAAALPVAAPSANLFSRPSPTRAEHVLHDLEGRIDMVIDGGATTMGIESTVLDLTADVPTVLRPGGVTLEMLRGVLPAVKMRDPAAPARPDAAMLSPGLLEKHYSPRTPLILYEGATAAVLETIAREAAERTAAGRRVAVVLADEDPAVAQAHAVRLGSEGDLATVAARLYAALRELDTGNLDLILVRAFPAAGGLGVAVQDRLRRAAAGRIVRVDR